MSETCYHRVDVSGGELRHGYGEHVHLLHDPLALTWLARVCHPACVQPEVNRIISLLYRGLVREVINREFPRRSVHSETRMREHTPRGYYEGVIIDPSTEVTTVDIARAGILPSMVCFEALCEILDPTRVRQDHLMMNRLVDERAQVTGAGLFGRKIAGPVAGRFLLFPDPMGATGGSLTEAIKFYLRELDGHPRHVYALNLIVTPEFIRRMTDEFPGLVSIYAYRLDRGLSDADVLAEPPGKFWERERGLTDHQYIVPGAGGMGEIMNNALS
jgi:uracil phosphoribosyltransferase